MKAKDIKVGDIIVVDVGYAPTSSMEECKVLHTCWGKDCWGDDVISMVLRNGFEEFNCTFPPESNV